MFEDGRGSPEVIVTDGEASGTEGAKTAALRAADWLHLGAAPTFAAMALFTAALGGGRPDFLCSADQSTWPLSGMVPMYLLMSAFHSAPWLRLISGRRRSGGAGMIRCAARSRVPAPTPTLSSRAASR